MSGTFTGKGKYSLYYSGNIITYDVIRHNVGIGVNPNIFSRLNVNSISDGNSYISSNNWIAASFGASNNSLNNI